MIRDICFLIFAILMTLFANGMAANFGSLWKDSALTATKIYNVEPKTSPVKYKARMFNITLAPTTANVICTPRLRAFTTLALFGFNAVIYIVSQLSNFRLLKKCAKINDRISTGEYYRILTATFLHGSRTHFACNMLSLFSLGPLVESFIGSIRVLGVYIFSGVFANFCTYILKLSPASTGSSGCICGLEGALLAFYCKNRHIMPTTSQTGAPSLLASIEE